ncbi:MAG TPA: HD domain-containing phosphohydrolase [Gaiellaceae bacterium]|nr:HD domain-containing phosphohydrolase [Gaiellaceae bacterium]
MSDAVDPLETLETVTVDVLIGLLEARNYETARHARRVGEMVRLVADELGLDPEQSALLAEASTLHDVGKLGLPDRVLLKAGPLTVDEREKMKLHTSIGHQMLAGTRVPLLEAAAVIAWTHHERHDGSGYPRGLRGGEIPLEGRLASVVDTFDALTNVRAYRPAYPIPAAVRYLTSERDRLFDAGVVDAFHAVIDDILELRPDVAHTTHVPAQP